MTPKAQNWQLSTQVSVQKTNDEELLLNLVRLKYRDTPFFMEVSSMASQFTLSSSANASASLQNGVKGLFGLDGSLGVTEKPTVTYSPLQGDRFIQRVLSPLPLDTITLLFNSGWNIERIFFIDYLYFPNPVCCHFLPFR